MPLGWILVLFGILFRMTEGVGLAMFITASFTLLPELYPTRVRLVKVSKEIFLITYMLYSGSMPSSSHVATCVLPRLF